MKMKNQPNFTLLREAYAIIGGIPEEKVDLWRVIDMGESLGCGTIACAAGWLSQHPTFKALGLGLRGSTQLTYKGLKNASGYSGAMAGVFNLTQPVAYDLFSGSHRGDISDKEEWLLRVRTYLKEHKQLSADCRARGEAA